MTNEILELIRQVEYEIEALDGNDVEGHIWWNKFLELIKNLNS